MVQSSSKYTTKMKRTRFITVHSHFGLVTPWGHTSGSNFAQVMTCSLMTTNHCLNYCWHIVKGIIRQFHNSCSTHMAQWVNVCVHMFYCVLVLKRLTKLLQSLSILSCIYRGSGAGISNNFYKILWDITTNQCNRHLFLVWVIWK